MTHSPAEILAKWLVDVGQGTSLGSGDGAWPTFATVEPPAPSDCVTVYDTQGRDDPRSAHGTLKQHYGLQLRVRSETHRAGYLKASELRTAVSALYEAAVTLGSSTYRVHAVVNIGQVLTLGREVGTTKRSLFTVNALTVVRQLT